MANSPIANPEAAELALDNLPHADEVWRGIGGHFDSLGQIICEFVDNSIANIMANDPPMRNIRISLKDETNRVRVTIEDSGVGISNLANAFRLGGKDSQEGPLNEHGFGMKHALASANAANDDWRVCTRTEADVSAQQYVQIAAPYKISLLPYSIVHESQARWPGVFHGTGTYVEFSTPKEMFNTLRSGMRGNAGFETCISYLIEDLGFVYAGLIERNEASFVVSWESQGITRDRTVAAVLPDWEQFYRPPGKGVEKADLGAGEVTIHYSFGSIKVSSHRKYYRKNMSSSGLEVRLNGRLLEHNVFKDVWAIERHNMYNHFLVTIDVVSSDSKRLPPTRTSKNGLRKGNPLLEELYKWVRHHMPVPPKDIASDPGERDLFEELAKLKRDHVPEPKTVKTEQHVFTTLGENVRVDLYLAYGKTLILFEGKKDSTTVKDVYQLKMYWDGAVIDGLRPTEGILVAAHHPDSVTRMVEHVNAQLDVSGEPYYFRVMTWKENGIPYPDN